jgi:quercetin 2,3-dioxygenase
MMEADTTKANIFPCVQRRGTETAEWRCLDCFDPGCLPVASRLHRVAELTIAAGKTIILETPCTGAMYLLPTVGTVACTTGKECINSVSAGAILTLPSKKGGSVFLSNPLQDGLIGVLVLFAATPAVSGRHQDFNLSTSSSKLLQISGGRNHLFIHIGMFEGRAEGTFQLQAEEHVFVYVIEGAFELQDRLVERGDGLLLWNCKHIEYEALSEGAILLIIKEDFTLVEPLNRFKDINALYACKPL